MQYALNHCVTEHDIMILKYCYQVRDYSCFIKILKSTDILESTHVGIENLPKPTSFMNND